MAAFEGNDSVYSYLRRILLAAFALVLLAKAAEDVHAWLTRRQCGRILCWSTQTKHSASTLPAAADKVARQLDPGARRHCASHEPGPLDWFQGVAGWVLLPLAFGGGILLPAWLLSRLTGVVRTGLGR